MKTKLTVAALAVFGLMLAGAPAFADDAATVNIPFSFTAMGQAMPAGDYQITQPEEGFLTLESVSNPALHVEMLELEQIASVNDSTQPKVVFDKTGNRDTLAKVWLDDGVGYVVYLPKH